MGSSYRQRWEQAVREELAAEAALGPSPVLTEADLVALPAPVRRLVAASGAVGRPVPRSFLLDFDAVMARRPGDRLPSTSRQVNLVRLAARLFLMRSRMLGLPVQALHLYRDAAASFQVKVAGAVTMVDRTGAEISRAETVTLLNDLVAFAPGALADPRLAWEPVDERSARVVLGNGPWSVAATVVVEDDRLVDFWSDDRPEDSGKELVQRRWRTPFDRWGVVDGIAGPTHGYAVYERPEGPFAYGEFTLRALRYDVDVAEALA